MSDKDEGVFKKPMSKSFKRVAERMEEDMETKTPTEAMRDDFGGSSEPTDEERENLEQRVEDERSHRG